MVEQSSQNWTGSVITHSVTRGRMSGLEIRKLFMNSVRLALVVDKEGHDRRKDSMVPLCPLSVFQHSGREHIPSLFPGIQWPDRASTRYLPERSLAWVVAFSVSHGEDPQDQNRG